MNKKLAQKWVNALRSGKYKQTQNTLQDSKGYCCLGVLCKISGKPLLKNAYGYIKGCGLEYQNLTYLTGNDSGLKVLGIGPIPLALLNDEGVPTTTDEFKLTPLNFEEFADVIQAVEILRVLD